MKQHFCILLSAALLLALTAAEATKSRVYKLMELLEQYVADSLQTTRFRFWKRVVVYK
ncbi:MAG: hypothetical protein Q4D50_06720 [Eubacteriales bacterium]|nr:hypothetical protein [Eubacteriales bacterium]